MLASNDRMVELEAIQCRTWVLKVELHELNSVGKGIERHLNTLGNRDELFFLFLYSMACKESKRF